MQGKDTTKSTFDQLFEAVTRFTQNVKDRGVDKYVKKFTAIKFILLMSYAQLNQLRSLREISNQLYDEQLADKLALSSISASQISRKQRSDLLEVIKALFYDVIRQAGIKQGFNQVRERLGQLHVIDSTVISLCLSQYRWADFRKTKSGIKIHLRLKLSNGAALPDAALITAAKKADRTQMDELITEDSDAFYVFDRAYLDYDKFDSYCDQDIRFASRLKASALVETVAEFKVNPESKIIKDSKVLLGKKGLNQMKNVLRVIEATDSEGKIIKIVTNDFTLTAQEIGDIYRNRWQIELFFKWIKQHLFVKHFYGTGEQAVELQLYIALTTYCLLTLLKQKTGYIGSLLSLKRIVNVSLYEPFPSLVRKLYGKDKRQSRGRRKIDHELIYQETLRQVIAGEADHLNDLSYDPVML